MEQVARNLIINLKRLDIRVHKMKIVFIHFIRANIKSVKKHQRGQEIKSNKINSIRVYHLYVVTFIVLHAFFMLNLGFLFVFQTYIYFFRYFKSS